MIPFGIIFFISGLFISMVLGAVFSWRQVSFICALFAASGVIAMFFVIFSEFEDNQKGNEWFRYVSGS